MAQTFRAIAVKHFCPVIIDKEFSILRSPQAILKLEDESLTVKVVSGAAEATVTYTVDEQPMEISVRLPPDFPLKTVEIKDVRRVGVTEQKWRGWLLNVQQLINSRVIIFFLSFSRRTWNPADRSFTVMQIAWPLARCFDSLQREYLGPL